MYLFFSDLDGTLLNDEKKVTDKTLDAIKAYLAAGNQFVIASGRASESILGVLRRAGLPTEDIVIVSYNGGHTWRTKDGATIAKHTISLETARIIRDLCRESGIYLQTYHKHKVVASTEGEELDYYLTNSRMEAILTDDILEFGEEPYKMLAIALDGHEKLLELQERIAQTLGTPQQGDSSKKAGTGDFGGITTLFSEPSFLEIMPLDSGKGNAILDVAKYFGVDIENTYAAGDADNDLSMLQAAGHAVVMCNGTDSAKALADIITERDNNHDGLADILWKLARG
ncbi:MAG: Cof-type HAD-IIB family hydrolase [Lachnospiraceae bacterium]|nr:Cof-type HAD-IIB family hydrolase [Lachnospiraceae bacterium]